MNHPAAAAPVAASAEPQRPLCLKCPHCDSDDIGRDAWANWDFARQDWVTGGTYDDMWCNACGEEFKEAAEVEAEVFAPVESPADLLRELIAQFPQFDGAEDTDLDISGADAVDWLGEFRERAKAALA